MCRQGDRTWKVSGKSDSSPFFDFPAEDTISLRGLYCSVQVTFLHDTGPGVPGILNLDVGGTSDSMSDLDMDVAHTASSWKLKMPTVCRQYLHKSREVTSARRLCGRTVSA